MTHTEARARLPTYDEVRMAEPQIPSVATLARQAGVSRDTFQQCFRQAVHNIESVRDILARLQG